MTFYETLSDLSINNNWKVKVENDFMKHSVTVVEYTIFGS